MTDVDTTTDNTVTEQRPWLFKPGQSGNPAGRPPGAKNKFSPTAAIQQIWEEHPEDFRKFVDEYLKDPNNRKHIVEMIDGKPGGDIVFGDKNTQNNVTIFGVEQLEQAFSIWIQKAINDEVVDGERIRPGCKQAIDDNWEKIERLHNA